MSGTTNPAVAGAHQDGTAEKTTAAEPFAQREAVEHGTAGSAGKSPVHELPSGLDLMSVPGGSERGGPLIRPCQASP